MQTGTIHQRLEALREIMREERLGAFVFPSTDPHLSEYVADHWKGREWISGFTGSAGTAVVTMEAAALWTDSRYFLAAEEQLAGTGFQLMRQGLDGTPSLDGWIGRQLADGPLKEVGIDGTVWAQAEVERLTLALRKQGGLTLRTNLDPLRRIWTDRPPLPTSPVTVHPLRLAGERVESKLGRIRQALRRQHADGMLLTTLDDIAWTLNLRGSDVRYNPVFVAYLLIASTKAVLYIDKEKLTPEARAQLTEAGVAVAGYDEVGKGLKDYFEYNILLDPETVNHTLFQAASSRPVVEAPSPVAQLKAVKNESEVAGFKAAMLRDGIAMVKFLRWLRPAVEEGRQTELSVSRRLEQLRAAAPSFRGLSFGTIAAYQAHGAIVHYEADEESDSPLRPEGLLLIDSGAQYEDGTTDITRTIALGPLTDEQRRAYTLVLKGHLALQNLCFPDGASGTQLDAVARRPLWSEGLNYLHGTGHGVGAYLNVHEGPHQIRMEWRPAPLREGMTVTDEPGLYVAGRFGVRIENTLLVVPHRETAFGRFLRFEPLTLCPVDTAPIVRDLLTAEETGWLNAYHALVRERLLPLLDAEEQAWLREATKPL